jgi:zinc/manganese transport system ATP-binding protein
MGAVTPPPIRLESVTLRYGTRDVVRGLTGSFACGSLTAVIGPNGAGKTTLLRAIAGLHKPSAGLIDRGGLPPAGIALLPQGSQLDRGFPVTCQDVVALGAAGRLGPFRAIGRPRLEVANRALQAVGLSGFGDRPIGALSAGQFQRVLFARLMLQDAPVLLLDEPFAGVDARTIHDLLAILRGWHARGRTIVAVLHDLDLVHDAFPRALLLAAPPVIEGQSVSGSAEGGVPASGSSPAPPSVIAWGPTAAALTEANRMGAGLLHQPGIPLRQPAL